jgi:hypothetical protein
MYGKQKQWYERLLGGLPYKAAFFILKSLSGY